MPTRTEYAQGTPSWIDLSTTDPGAAQSFYGPLMGWSFDTNPTPEGGEYTMATLDGKAAAGMMQQQPEQAKMGIPSLWNTYITVDDVAAAAGRVEEAGGSVMMPPMEVMDAGHMSVVVDPSGAVVCLWQPVESIGCEIVNEPGALCWNELVSDNVAAAVPFYKSVLGIDSAEQDIGGPDPYTMFMVGDAPVGGAMAPPMEGIPNHWSVYFAVGDTEATVAQATELGGTIIAPPFDTPVGLMAGIQDPTGATFSVIQLNDPESTD